MKRRAMKVLVVLLGIPLLPYFSAMLCAYHIPWLFPVPSRDTTFKDMTEAEAFQNYIVIGRWAAGVGSLIAIATALFVVILIALCIKNYVVHAEFTPSKSD